MAEHILNDIAKFTQYLPNIQACEPEDMEPLRAFIEEAEEWISDKLLGPELHTLIAGMEEMNDLKRNTQAVICLRAYQTAIPFLDLVQTPAGFAVVSNSNQAPASRERVERLLAFVARRLTNLLDKVISTIHSLPQYRETWKKAHAFTFRTEILFLTTAELQNYAGKKDAIYTDLDDCHPLIIRKQAEIEKHISRDFLKQLLQKRANNDLSGFEHNIFIALQTIAGLMMRQEEHYSLLEKLMNTLQENPDDCQAYMHSPQYRLKISQKYENKKNDPTFFFGG
jgi:hypothetical protein